MAKFIKRFKAAGASPLGKIAEAVLYVLMLALICLMITGNGEFIYEGF